MSRLLSAILCAAAFCVAATASNAQTIIITPPALHGCGTLTATTTSAVIGTGTLTLCPNSTAFPASILGVPIRVKVSGTSSSATVCWLGGTCAGVGELLMPGESAMKQFFYTSASAPSVVTASGTATIYVEW